MEREEIKSIVESLLFVAEGPQSLQRLGEILDSVDRATLQGVLNEIQADYESQNSGIRLVEVAGGYQLRTAKANADWVKKYLGGRPGTSLRATARIRLRSRRVVTTPSTSTPRIASTSALVIGWR